MLKKILFLILIVGIIPLVIGQCMVYFDQSAIIRESTGNEFQKNAEEISRQLDLVINRQISLVKTMACGDELRAKISAADKDALAGYLALKAKEYGWFGAKIITPETSDKEDKKLWEYMSGPNGGECLDNLYYSFREKIFSADIAVPVMEAGRMGAVLKAVISAEEIWQALKAWTKGQSGRARIIDFNSTVLIDPVQKESSYQLDPELGRKIHRLKNGWLQEEEKNRLTLYGFAPITASFRVPGGVLGEYRWFVLISQENDEALVKIYKLMSKSLALGLGLIAIIALVGGYIAYKFIQPIKLLRYGAQLIGQGNLDYRLDIKTKDEVEQLSNEFNNMAGKLKDIYEHLEDRIRERTRELEQANDRLQKNQLELQAAQAELLSTAEELEYANARMEEQTKELARLSQVKSEFVSMVSHELRTPLAAMKEGIALVTDGSVGEMNAMQAKLLGIVAANIDRLTRLINDLLDIAKIESGKMEIKIKQASVERLVHDNYEIMAPHARSKNINLALEIDKELPDVVVDIDRIMQVLSNLVNNAIKFTPDGGTVKVTAADKNAEFVEIAVMDTGIGVSPEDRQKLFQKFQQLDNKGMMRTPGGTGLGLALSKEIILAHGGMIDVESAAGRGSRFFFTLPKYAQVITAYKYLEGRIQLAGRNKVPLALIMLEIPEAQLYIPVKEMLGHVVRRPTDKVEYLGNKQIMIILDADLGGARIIEERIRENIQPRYPLKLGISVYPEDGTSREEIVLKAKQRWSEGKSNG